MVIQYGNGPMPEDDEIRLPESEASEYPGEEASVEDEPSLSPSQIASFSNQFYNDASSCYNIWRLCSDVISGWRLGRGVGIPAVPQMNGVAQWMRPRDIAVNLVQPLFRNVVARLSTEQPYVGVVPATESEDDIQKAQAAEQALRYHWRDAKVKQVLQTLVEWLTLHGTAGLLTYMEGDDVREEAIAPERLRAEPGVADPSESRFLAVTRITTREQLKRQFPDASRAIDEAPPPSMLTALPSNSPLGNRYAPDRVEVLEAYTRSGHWFLLVGEGGTVLAQGKTPRNCMPLQVVRYTHVPGQFFGMGMVEVVLDAQYAYSSVLNQMLRNARLMSNPKVLIERSSKVDENAFTTREGEKVFYSGVQPSVWVPPPLPAYFQQLPPLLQSLIHDQAGIHSTTLGKRAVGISSGRAIEALSANDLAQLQTTQDAIENAVQDMARCALLYMREYYSEGKMIREFDRGGSSIYTVLNSTDISEDPEVFIEADTLFSAEVKSRDQRTLDLLRLGLLEADQAKKMLSFHLDPLAPIKLITDIEHAKKVLQGVIDNPGVSAEVYPSDNLKVFEEVVGNFIRSDSYYELPKDRQDAVHQFYLRILNVGTPGAEEEQGAGVPAKPKLPMPVGAPPQPQMVSEYMPGSIDTTAEVDRALDAVEASAS